MARSDITPLRLPSFVRTLVVYGGSFDPPHFYHTMGPLSVVARLFGRRGWLLYVPAAQSPLKRGAAASDEHRLAMLRLALDVPGQRSIWTDELDRAARSRSPSYTIDSLRRLRRVVPERVSLRLLIGSDQAGHFHRWKNPREIIRLAEPLVMAREPATTAAGLYSMLDADFWSVSDKAAWCTRLAPNFPMPPSSTELRDAIPGAPSDPEAWADRPPLDTIITSVARYIIDHNLYGFRKGPSRPAGVASDQARAECFGDTPEGKRQFRHSMEVTVPKLVEKELERLSGPGGRPRARRSRR